MYILKCTKCKTAHTPYTGRCLACGCKISDYLGFK